MDNQNRYLSAAQELFSYTQALRRDFHRNPELGFHEERTAGIVACELKELDFEVHTGIAKTGVVALIEGSKPGPVVMLRFDMDALPIAEETGADYASNYPGIMHACGHDGHTAVGLTVARLLAGMQHEFKGAVKLVFQPAEEGLGGAQGMIDEGVLLNPRPDFALGMHIWNEKPLGWMGITPGPVMAAGEIFKVELSGKGGHGAQPHLAVDPLIAAAHLITTLQTIVSREVSPLETAVVSVTMIHGGEAFNVIPPQANLEGTIRTFKTDVRQLVLERFRQIVGGIAETYRCKASIDLQSLTTAVNNDPIVTSRVIRIAEYMFPEASIDQDFRTMGSEDMSHFLDEIPGCFYFLGSANSASGLMPHITILLLISMNRFYQTR